MAWLTAEFSPVAPIQFSPAETPLPVAVYVSSLRPRWGLLVAPERAQAARDQAAGTVQTSGNLDALIWAV